MKLALGVDSSTQSTKVEVRELESGRVVATAKAPHPPTGNPVSEQDPAAWWTALVQAVGQLGDCRRDVVAMSVAGQQHGLVLLDDSGDPVRPAKLWNDTTSAPQAASLVNRIGADNWARSCGSVPVASFTITKLAWMAEHEPNSLAKTAKVMLPHDYLTWRLTNRHVTDRGDASGSGWFDARSMEYKEELLASAVGEAAGWIDRLPTVLQPFEPAGELIDRAAAALGLPPGIVVAAGTGDNMAAAIGLGLEPGDVAMSLGTSGTIYSVSQTPTADPTGLVAGFADATGLYLPLACTLNATKVTDTVSAWLGTDAPGLSALALGAPIEPDGVVLIPYFDGERTPNRPNASGSFLGLRNTTSRSVLARAAHDGVLCGLFYGLEALADAGVDTTGTLYLTGGGARSEAYRQRCADLRAEPIVIPDAAETVATGAAVQAAAVHDMTALPPVAGRWGLGGGSRFEPRSGARGGEILAGFRAAIEA